MVGEEVHSTDARRSGAHWATERERGSLWLLRVMTFLSLRLGRPAARVVLYGIATYFFLFAPRARRAMCRYLAHALNRPPTARDRFRLILSFATTIHDRVYLLNGRFSVFELTVTGSEALADDCAQRRGVLLMGAHLGSFEAVRAVGRRVPGLHVVMAMYERNARKINAMLAAINPGLAADVLPLGSLDSMLRLRASLEAGDCVGLLGDRTFGGEAPLTVPFLGEPAAFPTGAMKVAAVLRRRVVFMAGLYRGGNRYHVVFEELADFRELPAGERSAAVAAAVRRYAATLERYCRSDPYNWFNFFDPWQAVPAGPES